MGSKPKIPDPVPPPAPPPPPEPVAERVDNAAAKKRKQVKRRGASSLTVRRATVNTGSGGSGANINY